MTHGWPGMMKRRTAAAYLDMTEPAFAREVLAGRLPPAIMLGAREHWRKDAIDAAIAALSGDGKPDYLKDFENRYGPQAA